MRNIKEFKEKWQGKPAQFMDSVQHEIHRFFVAYTQEHLLLFQTGNSEAASENSSIGSLKRRVDFILSKEKNIHTDNTSRLWDPDTSLYVCVCLTRESSGCYCRHLLCVLTHIGHGFDGQNMDKRFKCRFNLPSADEIIAEFSSVCTTQGSPKQPSMHNLMQWNTS